MRCLVVAFALLLTACAPGAPRTPAQRVAAMHVRELPSARPGDTLVVFYSGDGGWAGIDQGVASRLAAQGYPVVGVNSLRYFLRGHTARDAGADLAAAIETYAARWGRKRVILVGFSFGADAMPVIVPQLPPATRARVRSLVLVGAHAEGELKFHVGDWMNIPSRNAFPVAPLLEQLRGLPMTCIYGTEDRFADCKDFPPSLIRIVPLPGGHHLDGAYDEVARLILATG